MTETASSLDVSIGNRKVGELRLSGSDTCIFQFQKSYIEDPDRPTLSLSFNTINGELFDKPIVTTLALHPFFSNLLPEGDLRVYLATLHRVKPVREYFLIDALGMDLPGNVLVRSAEESIEVNEIAESNSTEEDEEKLTFSLAGVQLKFSALVKATGGLTIPANGMGGDWIVKLPSAHYSSIPENEYHMLDFARKVGIEVPEIRLLEIASIEGIPEQFLKDSKEKALAIKRFDRPGQGERVHVEDMAQVFGVYPLNKYKKYNHNSIGRLVSDECTFDDMREYLRRLVFNVAIGNSDMHLKNWSLIYRDGVNPSLAPAYDFVCTIAELPDNKIALRLGETREYAEISMHQFSLLARAAGFPKGATKAVVEETIESIKNTWCDKKTEIDKFGRVVEAIDRQLSTVPLFR